MIQCEQASCAQNPGSTSDHETKHRSKVVKKTPKFRWMTQLARCPTTNSAELFL